MVRDLISKLEPALENRINKHSSQTENLKELTGILATVIVMNENGLMVEPLHRVVGKEELAVQVLLG
ncbi:hypothetical protein [Providencia sp. Me31A]|uniref:hypothetical protein n=1 Tax=Providencia sp. Me31A TaxID=3392637 RepID=UPI003D2928E2